MLNLLEAMKERYELTLLFITHDLAVVKAISDRIIVMYLGKICEVAPSAELYVHPAHHYTSTLIDAIPITDPDAEVRPGVGLDAELPSPLDPPSGRRFRTRCPRAEERCTVEEPQMREIPPGHFVACHFPIDAEPAPAPAAPAATEAAAS